MLKRYRYIDVLKTYAIIAVIMIHASAALFYSYSDEPLSWWWIGNIVNSCSRWAVPVFLLCSGALMLSHEEESNINFFKKRLKKVVIPLIAWSIIYFLWKNRLSDNISINSIKQEIKTVLQSGNYFHLHFLYYLLGLYLITPILRVFIRNAKRSDIQYYLALWLAGTVLYPCIKRYWGIDLGIPISTVTGFVGYYLLGHYLHNFIINRKSSFVLFAAGIAGLIITIIGTYILTHNSGIPNEHFYEYLNISVIMPSLMVFVLIKNTSNDSNRLDGWYRLFSNYSFGIYLIHPIVLELLSTYGINARFIHPSIGLPVSIISVFIISLIVIYLLKKVPIIRTFVP